MADTVPEDLRPTLAELESGLEGGDYDRLAGRVLVLASTWVLGDAGFDLARYDAEARTYATVTPQHDRVLASFPDAMGYYMALRLMTNEADEVEPDAARRHLEAARAALAERAADAGAEFPLVAAAFRRLLEETAGGTPPDDRLWRALARRIGDRYVDDWLLRASQ